MDKILRMLFVLLLLLLPMMGVSAQDDDVFCGTLSAADCDILKANLVADTALTSMTYDLQITMSVLEEVAGTEPDILSISSAGSLASDQADLEAMKEEILNTTIGELLKLLDNPDALMARIFGYVERLVRAPAVDVQVAVVLPEGIEEAMPGFTMDVKMTDGVIYVTSPLLAAVDFPPNAWVSLDLVEAINMLAGMLQDPAFVEGLMSGMAEGVTPTTPKMGGEGSSAADMQAIFSQIAEIASAPYWDEMDTPEFMAQIETLTRLPDAEIDGVPVAVFEDRVDMAAMVASDPFQQAFSDLFGTFFPQDMSPEEVEAIKPVIFDMIASMDTVSTQAIGLEDHFTYSIVITWEMTVDPMAFVRAVTPEEEQADIDELPSQIQAFEFRQEIRDHNLPVVVTPPAEENVIPLLGLLMGGPPQ